MYNDQRAMITFQYPRRWHSIPLVTHNKFINKYVKSSKIIALFHGHIGHKMNESYVTLSNHQSGAQCSSSLSSNSSCRLPISLQKYTKLTVITSTSSYVTRLLLVVHTIDVFLRRFSFRRLRDRWRQCPAAQRAPS